MIFSRLNYHVTVNEYGRHGMAKSSKDKLSFLRSIIKGYRKTIDIEVDKFFYKDIPLYTNLSARYFVSSYGESIMYIYPSTTRSLRIDYVDKPVQVLLSHGLIDLNNPESDIHPEKLRVVVPADEARTEYDEMVSNLSVVEGDARNSAYIGINLRLVNYMKVIHFLSPEKLMTICGAKLIFSTSDEIAKKLYGKDMEFSYTLKGPLIISNITNFKSVTDIGNNIGTTLAEAHIRHLVRDSKSFKLYTNEQKVKPYAQEIVDKLKRAESDPSQYPLWQFKEDLYELHTYAEKEGISSTYVDDLMGMLKTGGMTGTLLKYYKTGHEFVIQWLFINAALFFCMTLLVFIKIGDASLISYIAPFLTSIKMERLLLSAIVVAINGWVFSVKPPHLDIKFWLMPGIAFLTNLCLSFYIQKYFVK